MNLTDDPRLTAYALDEMTAAERIAFERELANDLAARAEVDAIRAAAGLLSVGLRDELATIAATRGGTPQDAPSVAPVPADADLSPVTLRRTVARHWSVAAAAAVVVSGVVAAALLTSDRNLPAVAIGADATALQQGHAYGSAGNRSTLAVGDEGQQFGATRPQPTNTTPGIEPFHSSALAPNVTAAAPVVAADQKVSVEVSTTRQEVSHQMAPREAAGTPMAAVNAARNPPVASPARAPLGERHVVSSRQSAVRADDSNLADADGNGIAEAGLVPNIRAATANTPRSELARARRPEAMPFDFRGERQHGGGEGGQGSESYAPIQDNAFLNPTAVPLSTFGVDVDTASFANVRRYLAGGQLPPADAVRIEELINYFPTADAPPPATAPSGEDKPFAVHTEVGDCPWTPGHRLVRIALKGKVIENEKRPPSNLVFLIDVSGSMDEPNKLPLVQRSLRKLVGQLGENDRVAIVVYAGSSGMVLPSTRASDKAKILDAIDNLRAGGSTNGGEGIELAYKTAQESFIKNATNRVILCTDGDFNVGVTDRTALFDLIAAKAKAGVFLSVCGFGTGNTKDDTMEGLADKGNGQYAYIDTDREADKVFVGQIGGTLVTIAKDVKLQLEFNPATVKSYRLIGYENRVMAAQDFNNDLEDSGDIGAGHTVTALYEIEPTRHVRTAASPAPTTLKYQRTDAVDRDEPDLRALTERRAEIQRRLDEAVAAGGADDPIIKEFHGMLATVDADIARARGENGTSSSELLTLKLRFKKPDAPLEQGTSELIETVVRDQPVAADSASADFRFDASVAAFGMLLRDSPFKGSASWDLVRSLARGGIGPDAGGYRTEFLNMIDQAAQLRR